MSIYTKRGIMGNADIWITDYFSDQANDYISAIICSTFTHIFSYLRTRTTHRMGHILTLTERKLVIGKTIGKVGINSILIRAIRVSFFALMMGFEQREGPNQVECQYDLISAVSASTRARGSASCLIKGEHCVRIIHSSICRVMD